MTRSHILLSLALVFSTPTVASAQAPTESGRPMASRSELEAASASASADARAAIQRRLTEGDFRAGDLIALTVLEEATLTDTFTVRAGQALKLPNIPEFSIRGVLRSELTPFLTTRLGEYIRNPQVDAVALVRVAVTGAVGRPGFFSLPAETPASEVVMAAGGPGARGDINKVDVRRGQEIVLSREEMQRAFAAGTSLDQLDIQGGDQFVVGEQSGGWRGTLQTVGLITGVFTGIYFATRIFK